MNKLLEKFDNEYADKLGKRAVTFRKAFELFLEHGSGDIVETGSIRIKDNWEGDGYSTYILSELAIEKGCILHTVDIDCNTTQLCKEVTKENSAFIEYNTMDSVFFIFANCENIGFLYLDSYDCNPIGDSLDAQVHQLQEINAALPVLSKKAIVLLDDNDFINGGKTRLSKIKLKAFGFTNVLDKYQSLWTRGI